MRRKVIAFREFLYYSRLSSKNRRKVGVGGYKENDVRRPSSFHPPCTSFHRRPSTMDGRRTRNEGSVRDLPLHPWRWKTMASLEINFFLLAEIKT